MLEISLVSMALFDNSLSGLRMQLMTHRAGGKFKSMSARDLAMEPFSNMIRAICCSDFSEGELRGEWLWLGSADSILKNRLVRLIILTTSHLVVQEKKKHS